MTTTPEPEMKYEVYGEWLVAVTDGCNCNGGDAASSGMHEPYCGMEPLVRLDRIEALLEEQTDNLNLIKQMEFLADDLDRTGQIEGEPDHISSNRLGLQYASKRLKGLLEGDRIHKGERPEEFTGFGNPPAPSMTIEIRDRIDGPSTCRVTRRGEVIFRGVDLSVTLGQDESVEAKERRLMQTPCTQCSHTSESHGLYGCVRVSSEGGHQCACPYTMFGVLAHREQEKNEERTRAMRGT